MDLRRLRYFVVLAEECHFGRAAERLHMAQPPLSQQIRLLEEELGARLFDRTSRSVKLTKAGAYLYEECKPLLDKLQLAADRAGLVAKGIMGEVRVGFVSTFMNTSFPNALRCFREKNPMIILGLREHSTVRQFELLRDGTLDMGLVRLLDAPDLRGFTALPYHCESYMLAINEESELAALDPVPLQALHGQQLVLFPKESHPELHEAMLHALCRAGVKPCIYQESVSQYSVTALVAAGMGAGFVPRSMCSVRREGVAYREIKGDVPLVKLFTLHREDNRNPALQAFLEYLRDYRPPCHAIHEASRKNPLWQRCEESARASACLCGKT